MIKIDVICVRISYFVPQSKFQSSATGRQYPTRQNVSCSSTNVIYLATCCKCDLQCVGSTSTEFKITFRNHKSKMLKNRKTCDLAVHFNSSQHDISQMSFVIIEQIISFQTANLPVAIAYAVFVSSSPLLCARAMLYLINQVCLLSRV